MYADVFNPQGFLPQGESCVMTWLLGSVSISSLEPLGNSGKSPAGQSWHTIQPAAKLFRVAARYEPGAGVPLAVFASAHVCGPEIGPEVVVVVVGPAVVVVT